MQLPYGIDEKDLAIFGAGVVLTLITGYIFYRLGLNRKQLVYAEKTETLIFRRKGYPSDLTIKYKDRSIESVTRTTLYLRNDLPSFFGPGLT